MQEQRRFKRWQVGQMIRWRLEGQEGWRDVPLEDISMAGMCVKLPLDIPFETSMKMVFFLSNFEIQVEANPQWQQRKEDGFVCGFLFNRIKDEDKDKVSLYLRRFTAQEW